MTKPDAPQPAPQAVAVVACAKAGAGTSAGGPPKTTSSTSTQPPPATTTVQQKRPTLVQRAGGVGRLHAGPRAHAGAAGDHGTTDSHARAAAAPDHGDSRTTCRPPPQSSWRLPPLPPPDLPPVPDSEDDQLDDDTRRCTARRHAATMVQGRHGASPPRGAGVGCCLVSRRRPDSDRADRPPPTRRSRTRLRRRLSLRPAMSPGSKSAWHGDGMVTFWTATLQWCGRCPTGQVRQPHARGLL